MININFPIYLLKHYLNYLIALVIFHLLNLIRGKKIENMYRLYCNKISKNNKIPLLKENIASYAKKYWKKNTLSMQ